MKKTFQAYIDQIKSLALNGEKSHVEKMLVVIELFHHSALWEEQYKNWDSCMKANKLGTPSLFRNFQVASTLLDVGELRRYGVRASASIGRCPPEIRKEVLRKTRAWVKEHKTPPEYQLIEEFKKDLLPPRPKTTVQELRDHISKQNHLLRAHGIAPLPFLKERSPKKSASGKRSASSAA